MPRKQMTPEERKAFGQKMKAARAAKSTKKEPTVDTDNVTALLKRIEELEQRQFFTPPPSAPAVAVRSITKFSVDPNDYPDPRERLANEPRLEEHAFKKNYELSWKVGRVNYDSNGVHYLEPKFQIELWGIYRDPETGEQTNKRYKIHKATFFEDPTAAVQLAHEKGLDTTNLEREFMDEMRYLSMRDWLMECFYPAKPTGQKSNKKEEVIGNRLVEVFEINSETAETIPFSQLRTRL